jgi:hypothetical protein
MGCLEKWFIPALWPLCSSGAGTRTLDAGAPPLARLPEGLGRHYWIRIVLSTSNALATSCGASRGGM